MKKNFKHFVLLLVLTLGLYGCSIPYILTPEDMYKIKPGMSTEQIEQLLGKPDFRRFNPEIEAWEYIKLVMGTKTNIIICFRDGKVISMDSFKAPVTNEPDSKKG